MYSIYGRPVQRRVVSEILHYRKFWTTVRSLVLFSECSRTGLILIEEVPIDPEVMADIEGIPYVSRVPRGCAGAISEGFQVM